jgi:hypothetical protein
MWHYGPNFQSSSLKDLRRKVENITLPHVKPDNSDCGGEALLPLVSRDAWQVEQDELYKVLADTRPGSVLDIGSGTALCSRLAALLDTRVVSFHTESAYATQLYYQARDGKLPILPLIMDFTDPTPARGLFSHWAIAATERFQCDMVLALAQVHHLVFRRHFNFDQIADGLALFSKRWLIVEFIPSKDQEVCNQWPDRFLWYTLDNLINALRRRFRDISIVPSCSQRRILLVCDKERTA